MRPTVPVVHRLILKAEFFPAIDSWDFFPSTYFLANTISMLSEFTQLWGVFCLGDIPGCWERGHFFVSKY